MLVALSLCPSLLRSNVSAQLVKLRLFVREGRGAMEERPEKVVLSNRFPPSFKRLDDRPQFELARWR